MLEVEGFILAGGASSRMGRDKAQLLLGGRTLVARAADALSGIARPVSVVSARETASVWGLPVVQDIHRGRGALGGLHAALCAAQSRWTAILSCDLPLVTRELWSRLAELGAEAEAALDAVVPFQMDGRAQPLCALYRRDACLVVVEEMLEAGELRPRLLLERVRTRRVEPDEWSDLKSAEAFFLNVNTPADYRAACEHWSLTKEG